jgi:hypothetical protein
MDVVWVVVSYSSMGVEQLDEWLAHFRDRASPKRTEH